MSNTTPQQKLESHVALMVCNATPMTRGQFRLDVRELPRSGTSDDAEGYLVKHRGGATEWWPELAFQQVTEPSFSVALKFLRDGHRVTRKDWGGVWIERIPQTSEGTHIVMRSTGRSPHAWAPMHDDLLAVDWECLPVELTA